MLEMQKSTMLHLIGPGKYRSTSLDHSEDRKELLPSLIENGDARVPKINLIYTYL